MAACRAGVGAVYFIHPSAVEILMSARPQSLLVLATALCGTAIAGTAHADPSYPPKAPPTTSITGGGGGTTFTGVVVEPRLPAAVGSRAPPDPPPRAPALPRPAPCPSRERRSFPSPVRVPRCSSPVAVC